MSYLISSDQFKSNKIQQLLVHGSLLIKCIKAQYVFVISSKVLYQIVVHNTIPNKSHIVNLCQPSLSRLCYMNTKQIDKQLDPLLAKQSKFEAKCGSRPRYLGIFFKNLPLPFNSAYNII